jgi:hypothetical protein
VKNDRVVNRQVQLGGSRDRSGHRTRNVRCLHTWILASRGEMRTSPGFS